MAATATRDLKAAARASALPVLKQAGFVGRWPTWNREDRHGDVATVNITSGKWTQGDYGEYFVNLAVSPRPWLQWWYEWQMGSFDLQRDRACDESGLYRSRLAPAGIVQPGSYKWLVTADHPVADTAAAITAILQHEGIPRLNRYQDRRFLIDALARDPSAHDFYLAPDVVVVPVVAQAVLLSDDGPSRALDEVCASLDAIRGPDQARRLAREAARWVRKNAQHPIGG